MAYKVKGIEIMIKHDHTLLDGMFGCYDTIGDPDYHIDRDETLHERSAYEFAREQLTPKQQAELDQVDAFWKARPEAFNADFQRFHWYDDKKTVMEGFVQDENGKTPAIPASHWWWWPIAD